MRDKDQQLIWEAYEDFPPPPPSPYDADLHGKKGVAEFDLVYWTSKEEMYEVEEFMQKIEEEFDENPDKFYHTHGLRQTSSTPTGWIGSDMVSVIDTNGKLNYAFQKGHIAEFEDWDSRSTDPQFVYQERPRDLKKDQLYRVTNVTSKYYAEAYVDMEITEEKARKYFKFDEIEVSKAGIKNI
tara:strand:- start:16 stop:564 length:549 start_codon:yes stop_codon:yes gene_type:complete